jgi:hypothetical protein
VASKRGKTVNRDEWRGRLENARAFLKSAEDLLGLAEISTNCNPVISSAINASIAFTDAITIKFAGIQNTGDHGGAPAALRNALGKRADKHQISRLTRLLSRKDSAQYGHRAASYDEASAALQLARRFAEWAESELLRP